MRQVVVVFITTMGLSLVACDKEAESPNRAAAQKSAVPPIKPVAAKADAPKTTDLPIKAVAAPKTAVPKTAVAGPKKAATPKGAQLGQPRNRPTPRKQARMAYYRAIKAFNDGDEQRFLSAHATDYCHYNNLKSVTDLQAMYKKHFAKPGQTLDVRLVLLADREETMLFLQTEVFTSKGGSKARYFKFLEMKKGTAGWQISALLTRKRNACRPKTLEGVSMVKVDARKAQYAAPAADGKTIPLSIMPLHCDSHIVEDDGRAVRWDGKTRFEIGCEAPRLVGWTSIFDFDDNYAGTTYVEHSFHKAGWIMVYTTSFCTVCEGSPYNKVEPFRNAKLYPPAATANCKKSPVCSQHALCIQKDGWCDHLGD